MKKWAAVLVMVVFPMSTFAGSDQYFHCVGMNDTQFPNPNVKLSKNWFGDRKLEVYAKGVWSKQKLLNDNEMEVLFEDGWGVTTNTFCELDQGIPSTCLTRKKILLSSYKGLNGEDRVRRHEYVTRTCCRNGKVVFPGEELDSGFCIVSNVLK